MKCLDFGKVSFQQLRCQFKYIFLTCFYMFMYVFLHCLVRSKYQLSFLKLNLHPIYHLYTTYIFFVNSEIIQVNFHKTTITIIITKDPFMRPKYVILQSCLKTVTSFLKEMQHGKIYGSSFRQKQNV